jgi:hypothetical protein
MPSLIFPPCVALSLTLIEAYAAPLLISALVVGAVIAALRWWTQTPAFDPSPKQSPVDQTSSPAAIDPQFLAVLAAAAYAVIGQPVVVRRVTFVGPYTVSAWAEVGRVQIQGSHNLHR